MKKEIDQLTEDELNEIKENYVKWKMYMDLIFSQYEMTENELIQTDLYRVGV